MLHNSNNVCEDISGESISSAPPSKGTAIPVVQPVELRVPRVAFPLFTIVYLVRHILSFTFLLQPLQSNITPNRIAVLLWFVFVPPYPHAVPVHA